MNENQKLDSLLIHTPKINSFYNPFGNHMFAMSMAMGLLGIADLTNSKGYKVQILHLGIEKINDPKFSIKSYIQQTTPKVVGLSLHWHFQSYDTIEVAREIKSANPGTFIVLGGYTASYFHQQILQEFEFIDGVIRGDGEVPFAKLTERISSNSKDLSVIPNLSWNNNGTIKINPIGYVAQNDDLNKINFSNLKLIKNYSLYMQCVKQDGIWIKGLPKFLNLTLLKSRQSMFPLSITRGCPLDCGFCPGSKTSQKLINGRENIAVRSIDKVIESIRQVKAYGYDTIYFEYLPMPYFEELFERIKAEKINVNCLMEAMVLPSPKIIQLFKETFCRGRHKSRLMLFVHSDSESCKRIYGVHYYNRNKLTDTLQYINRLKIPTRVYSVIGIIHEDEDVEDTKLLQSLESNYIKIIINGYDLVPGTTVFSDPLKYGLFNERKLFRDFYNYHKNINRSSFSSLGYHPSEGGIGYKDGAEDLGQIYEEKVQNKLCNEFCRLEFTFLFPLNSALFKKKYFRKITNRLARFLCGLLSFYWKIRRIDKY